jgi:DNA-binding MarR family transcriptional regulator
LCVNIDHLFLGTHADNSKDMRTKGRQALGSRNSHAKLTESDVRTIRERYQAGGVSMQQLATDFGVCRSSISMIINRVVWAHIAD